jgi:ATP-dependent Clp protease, protease subunit
VARVWIGGTTGPMLAVPREFGGVRGEVAGLPSTMSDASFARYRSLLSDSLRSTMPRAPCRGFGRSEQIGHLSYNLCAMTNPTSIDIRSEGGNGEGRSEVFTRLLKSRVVMLGTDVNDDIANAICAQLLFLESEDPSSDIWLYINSPGGSVTAGMAIYDTMNFVSCDVATVSLGLAASMGQFLLGAGAKGKRYALPNARIMMHQPSAGLRGQAADIAIQAEQLTYMKRQLAEEIARHTGQTVEQITLDSDRDRWFTAEGAKDYGIIDRVIRRRGEIV